MTQQQIKGDYGDLGADGELDVYKVPGSVVVTPFAVSVQIDGTNAAGSFLPCLTFKTQTGAIIARCPAPEVASGDTAEVSWFPHVGGAAAAASPLPIYVDYQPPILGGAVFLSDPVIQACATWVQNQYSGLVCGYAVVYLGTDLGDGGQYAINGLVAPGNITSELVDVTNLFVGFGTCWQFNPGNYTVQWPVSIDHNGALWYRDEGAGEWLAVDGTHPFTFAEGDQIFSGTWLGRILPD